MEHKQPYPIIDRVTDLDVYHMLNAWEVLRTKHREMPAQAVTVFLYIASHHPCHKQAIEKDQKLTTASCSRSIDLLSDGRKNVKTEGLGLVKAEVDPLNGRRLLLGLTSKGQELLDEMKQALK